MKNELGITVKKMENFSKWYDQVVTKAELADLRYNVKGFLVHKPLAVSAMKKMYYYFERELEKRGHKPVWFPAVIPESNFKKEAEHVAGFIPEVIVDNACRQQKLSERVALRPTSETAMYTMYAKWIRSWRDLPLKLYQSCQVWRYETKATRPFIRGREFYWIEAHDVFATRNEAEKQVIEDMKTTKAVMHEIFGIPFFQFQRPEWDKFPGAVHTYAADIIMPDGKILQQPSTHMLGQNFSKAFNIKFKNKNGQEEYAWQTCYGPAIWRIFAAIIAIHGDDKGLIFPWEIAPIQVVIIPIYKSQNKDLVLKRCVEIKDKLKGLEVYIDDRDEYTAGWKFNEWEMKGVPIRLEIGMKEVETNTVTIFRRDEGRKINVSDANISEYVEKVGKELSANLKRRAESFMSNMVRSAKNLKEVREALKKGGFVRVNFCSIDEDGRACAEKIKASLHADVRGKRIDVDEKPEGNCVVCGRKAKVVVYIGKSY